MASTSTLAALFIHFYFDLLAAVSKESLLFAFCGRGKQCACSFLHRIACPIAEQIERSAILAAKTSNCWPITPTQESIENL
jgi:hypothetical protein